MLSSLSSIISTINFYLFDYILIFMLVAVGFWYTIQTRFVQVRCFFEGARIILKNMSMNGSDQKVGVTSFRALMNAAGAQIGIGNIIGASSAVLIGGPGAIFWMWVTAFLGMATIYAETVSVLATRKIEINGTIKGGPAYYIREAFKNRFGKFLAVLFAVSTIISVSLMNFLIQSNSVSTVFNNTFGIPYWLTGMVFTTIFGAIVIGGLNRVSYVTEKLVPMMSYIFIGGAIAVLIARIQYLPEAVYLIFYYAFQPQAIIGGGFGEALRIAVTQGVKRSLFSNEAGTGSGSLAHVQANVKDPHEQGVIAMHGVFLDTFVILTLNALVIISTLYTSGGILANGFNRELALAVDPNNLAQLGFGSVLDANNFEGLGAQFVAVFIFLFAFSNTLVSYLFGKMNVEYLLGDKNIHFYYIAAIILVFVGAFKGSELIWELKDLSNGFMMLPNILALFALTKLVKSNCSSSKKL